MYLMKDLFCSFPGNHCCRRSMHHRPVQGRPKRFVCGETLESGINDIRLLNQSGIKVTLDRASVCRKAKPVAA